MSWWKRALAAWFMTVIVVGMLAIVDIFLHADIGDFVISPPFVGVMFGVSYLVAPFVTKYINLNDVLLSTC